MCTAPNPDVIALSFLIAMMEDTYKEFDEVMSASIRKNLRRRIERDATSVKVVSVDGFMYLSQKY